MDRPLRYGDLVYTDQAEPGIVLSHDPSGPIELAMGNGLQLTVPRHRLEPIPLSMDATEPANFAEWVGRQRQPVDRAVYGFMGNSKPPDVQGDDYDAAVIGLFVSLARMVANMSDAAFGDMTKAEYLESITSLLGKRQANTAH
jgi:hypothetical protein